MSKVLTEEEVLSLLAKVASLHPWRHEVNFLRDHITTLQSERDALREVLFELIHQIDLSGAVDDHGHELKNLEALRVARATLSTPASGEPARKP